MHPIICKIGPVTVFSYGLMIVLAFLAGSILAARQAKRQGMDPEVISDFSLIVFLSGILGARLFYVFENFAYYLRNPVEIVMLQRGGLSWYGGLVLAVFAAVVYIKKKKIPLYDTLDTMVPFVALAGSIGRIGCFFNGCCYGRASTFGLYSPIHGAWIIPAQLYSSLLLLVIFLVLRLLQDKPHKSGEIFYAYLLLYSLKRFFIEFIRADNPAIFWSLSLFQLISIAIFLAASFKLCLFRVKTK